MESKQNTDDQQGGEAQQTATSVRLAVDNERLDMDDPLHYLVGLATEARRYDGNWDGDSEEAAKWVIAQWCQEIGWAPDLREYGPGEQVEKQDELLHCDWAFRAPAGFEA